MLGYLGRTVAQYEPDVSISRIADDCIELIRHLGLGSQIRGRSGSVVSEHVLLDILCAFFEQAENLCEALQLAVDYPCPQSAVGFEKQVNAIAAYDATGDLSRINTQTLVIGGEEDILFPPAVITDLARAIPGASLWMIDKSSHSIHMEQSREFTRCVIDFLH